MSLPAPAGTAAGRRAAGGQDPSTSLPGFQASAETRPWLFPCGTPSRGAAWPGSLSPCALGHLPTASGSRLCCFKRGRISRPCGSWRSPTGPRAPRRQAGPCWAPRGHTSLVGLPTPGSVLLEGWTAPHQEPAVSRRCWAGAGLPLGLGLSIPPAALETSRQRNSSHGKKKGDVFLQTATAKGTLSATRPRDPGPH